MDILRDRKGLGGADLALGNAAPSTHSFATHSVVMDVTDWVLWVSEGPHLVGRYVRFDLGKLLAAHFERRRMNP